MHVSPQKFREIVLQILFAMNGKMSTEKDILNLLQGEYTYPKETLNLALQRAKAVETHQEEIDEILQKAASNYEFERIQNVEKNVLRLALYELLFEKEIPPKVAIAEGLRLSKKFSSPESLTFVNAILDAIYKERL